MTRRFRCGKCGSFEGYHSRYRSLAERLFLSLFLLRPVRCGACFRRSYQLIFTKLLKRDEFQMVTEVMASRMSALQTPPSEPYTGEDSSGHVPPGPVSRTEEVRLQQ
jgi:hypothetical protein